MDREFGKVERSSINEITLYRSIISPKRIPSLPLFRGPFLPYPSFEHVALPLSLKFQQEGRNVTWLFPSSDKRYLLLSIFPKFSSCRRDKSSKKNRFQHLSCFFFFFFLLKTSSFFFWKLGEKISIGNDRFRARFNFQFSIFDFSSKVRFEFFASLFFSLILRKLKFYETMYTRGGQGTGLSVRRFLVELPLKVTISSVEKTLGERIERTLLL